MHPESGLSASVLADLDGHSLEVEVQGGEVVDTRAAQ